IRDLIVTGVQTCALPISLSKGWSSDEIARVEADSLLPPKPSASTAWLDPSSPISATLPGPASEYVQVIRPCVAKSCHPSVVPTRSEERRVGKGGTAWRRA